MSAELGTGRASHVCMSNTKFLTAIIVPALSFGAFKLWSAAEDSLAAFQSPTTAVAAVIALAAAADQSAAPAQVPQFRKPAPIITLTSADDEALPPIGAGPQSILPPEPLTAPTVADVKAEIASAQAIAKAEVKFQNTDILSGTEQGIVQQTLIGNGRDRLIAKLRNNSPTPLRVGIPAGQVFESGRNLVIVARPAEAELMPAQSLDVRLVTVALYSANKIGESSYKPSYQTAPKLEAFLAWVAQHPEVGAPALQTAVLALTENLPLNSLSKFAPTNGITSKLPTDAFRVETGDLIGALTALRESGTRLDTVALSLDPQLRIEAMIEPLSRESAKRFYGITEDREWDFWKHELLNGDPGTRHYALFGIARFYPQVAVEMLPKWARETKTHPVYRMSAVQALAETQRPEALPILHGLATELGAMTELGKAATQAAQYLDTRLSQNANARPAVAFRGKKSVSGF